MNHSVGVCTDLATTVAIITSEENLIRGRDIEKLGAITGLCTEFDRVKNIKIANLKYPF